MTRSSPKSKRRSPGGVRPANDELLHPNYADDNDIPTLYDIADWRELADAKVENEYAAVARFLEAMSAYEEVDAALLYWLDRSGKRPPYRPE